MFRRILEMLEVSKNRFQNFTSQHLKELLTLRVCRKFSDKYFETIEIEGKKFFGLFQVLTMQLQCFQIFFRTFVVECVKFQLPISSELLWLQKASFFAIFLQNFSFSKLLFINGGKRVQDLVHYRKIHYIEKKFTLFQINFRYSILVLKLRMRDEKIESRITDFFELRVAY